MSSWRSCRCLLQVPGLHRGGHVEVRTLILLGGADRSRTNFFALDSLMPTPFFEVPQSLVARFTGHGPWRTIPRLCVDAQNSWQRQKEGTSHAPSDAQKMRLTGKGLTPIRQPLCRDRSAPVQDGSEEKARQERLTFPATCAGIDCHGAILVAPIG